MVKFMILFKIPADIEAFETVYNDFLALVERIQNVRRRQVITITGSPLGTTDLYRILEVYFDDEAAMTAALRTQAGQEAGGELRRFPPKTFELLFANIYEEAGGSTPQ